MPTCRDQQPTAARRLHWLGAGLFAVWTIGAFAGCTYTVAGDIPAASESAPPAQPPAVEHTVADFTFVLGGGDPEPAIFDGRLLSNEIVAAWQKRGYVRSQDYVADGEFSDAADYRMTLRGSQRGDTSLTLQIISALTLSLLPYTVTQHYEFDYLLEDVRSGAQYRAAVQASDTTWVQPFLIFALPFAARGHLTTMQRVGDNLFAEFQRQGAFATPTSATVGQAQSADSIPRSP